MSSELPDMVGGVGDHTVQLACALSARGVEVWLLGGSSERIKPLEGLPLIQVPDWGLRGLFTTLRTCAEQRIEAVLFQYGPYMYSRWGVPWQLPLWFIALNWRMPRPIILICHELFIFAPRGRHRVIAWLQRVVLLQLAHLSSATVVATSMRADALCRAGTRRASLNVIPVGPTIRAKLPPEGSDDQLRRPDRLRVLVFGWLELRRRRLDVVVEAARRVAEAHPELVVQLVLAGPVPSATLTFLTEQSQVPSRLRLEMLGVCSADQIAGEIEKADTAILFDTSGLGGLSARSTACASCLAAGLPVISNRGGDTDRFFVDRVNVLLSDPEPGALTAVLEDLAADPSLRRALRRGARELFERQFDWNRIADSFVELLSRPA